MIDTNLKIVSFNIQSLPTVFGLIPLSKNNKLRRQKLKQILAENYADEKNGFDIILLQEVWTDQAEFADCGYHFVSLHDQVPNGLAILSRWEILDQDTIAYDNYGNAPILEGTGFPNYFNKGVLYAEIAHPQGNIDIFNTHLISCYADFGKYFWQERREQITQLGEFMEDKHPDGKVIVGGDFNCGPNSPDDGPAAQVKGIPSDNYTYLCEEIFKNLHQGDFKTHEFSTCSVNNSKIKHEEGKVDHIFYSEHFTFKTAGIDFNEQIKLSTNGKNKNVITDFLSDHFAWKIDISVKT